VRETFLLSLDDLLEVTHVRCATASGLGSNLNALLSKDEGTKVPVKLFNEFWTH